jgi:hypothetical protein
MKKIFLLFILLALTLDAKGIFSTLPYKIEIGKELPKIVESKMVKTKIQYQLTGKFALTFYNEKKKIVKSVIFAYGDYDMPILVPKVWARAGIEFCYDGDNGTPYTYMRDLIKKNHAKDIDVESDQTSITLSFTIDDNKRYEMIFFKHNVRDAHGKGLAYITVSKPEASGDEYY